MLLSMGCVCRKLDSAILVMKSAEDRQQAATPQDGRAFAVARRLNGSDAVP
jgi:hypothetical protein